MSEDKIPLTNKAVFSKFEIGTEMTDSYLCQRCLMPTNAINTEETTKCPHCHFKSKPFSCRVMRAYKLVKGTKKYID